MALQCSVEQRTAQPVAVTRQSVPDSVDGQIGKAIHGVHDYLMSVGAEVVGPAFGRSTWVPGTPLEIGFPVATPVAGNEQVMAAELPAGRVATAVHTGPYEGVRQSMAELQAWATEQGLTGNGTPWETYISNPREVSNPEELQNGLFIPVA